MVRFYSERPGQVEGAVDRTLDTIAPASAQPSTLCPRAAEAAQGELDAVNRSINTVTRPAYQAAEAHVIDPADFAPIAADPAFQASLRRLRNDEVLGPTYARQPDNSVAVIDAVTKDMRARGVALGNAANPDFQPQAAGVYGTGRPKPGTSHAARHGAGCRRMTTRWGCRSRPGVRTCSRSSSGPLGRVAAATDTQGVTNPVLPAKPLTGGEGELVDAIMRIERQEPGLGASLVRQRRRISTTRAPAASSAAKISTAARVLPKTSPARRRPRRT
ncbi:hypothetical protein N2605_26920 [Bradyrhizobium yuanmingense]|uniref:hypothetical protein n=1 Tax=Bradyrhizobium yuanmingense TaxID=108015 RepID=UPI0021A55983|nr:hypothetical protein [Bradyrhizobium sp. CB1024]UWU83157.1 hypothetical protein N2605_26920 [Bradyrhizobium sp. CB1024]